MIDFSAELEEILEKDPLGLLNVRPRGSQAISADDRLVAAFEEINAFVAEHGREPQETREIQERKLHSRLRGLRESPAKVEALRSLDTHGLLNGVTLPEPKEIKTIDDVLGDDALGHQGMATTADRSQSASGSR